MDVLFWSAILFFLILVIVFLYHKKNRINVSRIFNEEFVSDENYKKYINDKKRMKKNIKESRKHEKKTNKNFFHLSDMVKEYFIKIGTVILFISITLLIRIFLVPIIGWNIFWIALLFFVSILISLLTCYCKSAATIYKDTNSTFWSDTFKVQKPDRFYYEQINRIDLFEEHLIKYSMYTEKLKNIEKYVDHEDFVSGYILLFEVWAFICLFTESIIKTYVDNNYIDIIATLVILALIFLSYFFINKVYNKYTVIKNFKYTDTEYRDLYYRKTNNYAFHIQYEYKKLEEHYNYLESIKRQEEKRYKFIRFSNYTALLTAWVILPIAITIFG